MRALARIYEKTNPVIMAAANLLFPPRCVSCGVDVESAHRFCNDCFTSLQMIDAPFCAQCGEPFAYDMGQGAICSSCMQNAPPYTQARAAMRYDEASRKLITRLKYADKQELLPVLSAQLWRAGSTLAAKADLIIPVPLHPKRLRERKYNQSALLAHNLARRCAKPVLPGGLIRVQNTPPQASLSRKERLENVKHAFRANHKHARQLRGAKVLLVDDVITTGATIDACSKALLGAGVKEVYVLTIAKTVKE